MSTSTASSADSRSGPRTDNPSEAGPSRKSIRTILGSSLVGTTIEWYDFFLYATAAGLVFDKLFFPNASETVGTLLSFVTFFAGFVARPIGGVLFGHIGDRIGRKRTLVSTMLLMGVSTALMGALPTYEQVGLLAPVLLVLLRLVQGLAIGGEWAGSVLVAVEHAPADRRGRFGAWPQVGLPLGLGLGTGLFALLGQAMDDKAFLSYGWRIAFGVSVVLVAVGLVVRLKVAETPAFQEVSRNESFARVPFFELFRTANSRRVTTLGLLARWGEGAAFNTWAVFLITYSTKELKLAKNDVLIAVMLAAVLMAILVPLLGRVTDRRGARGVFAVGTAFFGISVFPAFWALQSKNILVLGVVVLVTLGVGYAITLAPEGLLFASLYPSRLRYTGMSFVYQASGIYASGLTPLIVTSLLAVLGGSPWLACTYLVATSVVSLVATLLLRTDEFTLPQATAPSHRDDGYATTATRRRSSVAAEA